jgi:hypothetical protein
MVVAVQIGVDGRAVDVLDALAECDRTVQPAGWGQDIA